MAGGPVAGTQYPTSPVSGGTTYNSTGQLEFHIFNTGLEKPDVLEAVITKFPQFYLLSLLDKIGATSEIPNDSLAWQIMGRTRKSALITAISNGTTTAATITLDTAYVAANGNLGYWLPGDTFRVAESEVIGVVVSVSNSGAFQTAIVARFDGAAWATTTINSAFSIGHTGSMYGEGSTGAGGYRNYFPDNDWNVTTKMRRDFKVTRDAMKSKKWATKDGKDWWYAAEDYEQKEILRDIEATLLCGKRFKASAAQGASLSRGLFEYASGSGITKTFSSALGIQEADLSDFVVQISQQQGDNDLVALCHPQILADVNHALADRYRSIPNSEKPAVLAGLDFQTYQIIGKKIHFANYEMFTDTSIFPAVAASATVKDPRQLMLVLDFSQTEHGTNIQMKYRDGARLIQKMIPGMASPGLEVSNKFDGTEGALLTEFMPVCFLPNRLGLIYGV